MKKQKTEKLEDILSREGYLESLDPNLKRAFEVASDVPEEIKSPEAFKMRKDRIKLSGDGAFYTLQGEGPTMGFPCVFVRLHVCNLRCVWCDAWYTWNPETNEYWTEPRDVEFEDCVNLIYQTWAGPQEMPLRIVWTGGEPLIQRKQIDEVCKRIDEWEEIRPDFEIETNGTLMPTDYQLEHFQFNVSPKLDNSENTHHSMVKPKVLEVLNKANSTFKFVVMEETDLDEIEAKYLPHIAHEKVILMPQGVTAEEVDMNMKKIAEPAKERGYRVLGRMQAQFAHGAERRV